MSHLFLSTTIRNCNLLRCVFMWLTSLDLCNCFVEVRYNLPNVAKDRKENNTNLKLKVKVACLLSIMSSFPSLLYDFIVWTTMIEIIFHSDNPLWKRFSGNLDKIFPKNWLCLSWKTFLVHFVTHTWRTNLSYEYSILTFSNIKCKKVSKFDKDLCKNAEIVDKYALI